VVQRTIPSPDPSSPDRSKVTRRAILEAAKELFVTKGYSATSVADIVDRAGTSVGLPYYHFGSKKKIFTAIWDEYQLAQEARTHSAVAQARRRGDNGPAALLAGVRAYLEGAWVDRDIQPMIHASDKPAGFKAVVSLANERYLRQNEKLLAELGPERARIASVLAAAAMGGMCVEFGSCESDDVAQRAIDTSLEFLGAMFTSRR